MFAPTFAFAFASSRPPSPGPHASLSSSIARSDNMLPPLLLPMMMMMIHKLASGFIWGRPLGQQLPGSERLKSRFVLGELVRLN